MAKIIAHIDLNAFFATCEELRDPSLADKPVIIGHPGRSGIVSTCNYVARKYGIHSGQPTFQAVKLCPDVLIVPPDYEYYKVMSNSFFAYIKQYSRLVESASVDECFVDFTDVLSKIKDPVAYFRDLQFGLFHQTGLKCSIGVAPTKWLAKMASDMKKPMGLTFLRRRDLKQTLYPLPIESFWGIGKKTAPTLRKMGIDTIGDLAARCASDDPEIEHLLGKFYSTVKEWVQGYGSDEVSTEQWDPKSIGNSETLMRDIDSLSDALETIDSLSREVSARAKEARKMGYTVTLTVKTTDFRLHSKAFTFSDQPTNDAQLLREKAVEMYRDNYDGMPVRLIGITLGKLVDPAKDTVQMSLWNYEEYEERDATKLLIAELNRKLKADALMRGSQAKSKKGKKDGSN